MKQEVVLKITLFLMVLLLFGFNEISAQNLDNKILNSIHTERNKQLDPIFHVFGQSAPILSIAYPIGFGLAGLFKSDSSLFVQGISAGFGLSFCATLAYGLKEAIRRPRPFQQNKEIIVPYNAPKSYSFVSGHTSNAFETAMHLSLSCKKWYVVLPAFGWASTVAYSRIHEGVHYPSDILAGAILGTGSAWLTYKANKLIGRKTSKTRRKILKW